MFQKNILFFCFFFDFFASVNAFSHLPPAEPMRKETLQNYPKNIERKRMMELKSRKILKRERKMDSREGNTLKEKDRMPEKRLEKYIKKKKEKY